MNPGLFDPRLQTLNHRLHFTTQEMLIVGVRITRAIFYTMLGMWLGVGLVLLGVKVKCPGTEACGEKSPKCSLVLIESHSDTVKIENVLHQLQVSVHSE